MPSRLGRSEVVKRTIAFCVTSALILSLAACTDPYDPAQRFVGGGPTWRRCRSGDRGCCWRRTRGRPWCRNRWCHRCYWRCCDHTAAVRQLLLVSRLLWIPRLLLVSEPLRLLRVLPVVSAEANIGGPRKPRRNVLIRPPNSQLPRGLIAVPMSSTDFSPLPVSLSDRPFVPSPAIGDLGW